MIDFIGTGINIIDYTWDFDGGTIISGSGMGPYSVSWDEPGTKMVSLISTDINGCPSNQTTKEIIVKAPLTPTEVTCIPDVGEVTFTWEIPLMVSGFEVNVLTGQTGGVFMANSFSVSGLEEGELVTIELLTQPDDPVCGEFVTTTASCTALDCIPPQVELSAENNVCEDGDNIDIDATITSGETGTGVFSGPGIVDAVNGIFDPSTANIGSNTIFYEFTSDVAGCTATETISINVFAIPSASFEQDRDTMCITEVLNLDFTGSIGAETFIWSFDGGQGSGLLTDQEVVFSQPGLKTITLQVIANGCMSEVFSSEVLVEAELEAISIQCDTAGTDFVTFSWNEVAGVNLYEVTVDNNPSFFTPETMITVDDLAEDQEVTITVMALTNSVCPPSNSTSACTTMISPVSVDDIGTSIQIYPNPAQDVIFVEGLSRKATYQIFTAIGGEVLSGKIQIRQYRRIEFNSWNLRIESHGRRQNRL